jgi:hypothetical protein
MTALPGLLSTTSDNDTSARLSQNALSNASKWPGIRPSLGARCA